MRKMSTGSLPAYAVLGFVTLCFIVFELCCYRYVDEWIYLHGKGETFSEFWACTGGSNRTWSDLLTSSADHYRHTNGRLADKLLIFVNFVPSWQARLILGFSFGFMLLFLWRICQAGARSLRPLPFVLMLWLIMILAPWNHQFTSVSVGFNYLLSAALVLAVSYRFLEAKPLSPTSCIGWVLLSFIAGAMHEGFSIPVLAGLGAAVLAGYRPAKSHGLLAFGFIAGLTVLLLSPSSAGRIGSAGWNLFNFSWLIDYLCRVPALWIMLLSLICFLIRKGRRNVTRQEKFAIVFLAVSAMVAMIIALIVGVRGRSVWFPSIIMCALSVMLLRLSWPTLFAGFHPIIVSILGYGLGVWLLWAAVVQAHYSSQLRELERRVISTGSPLVAMDLNNFNDTNPFLLQLPQAPLSEAYYDDFFYNFLAMKCSLMPGTPGTSIVVIPEKLKGLHYTLWPKAGKDFYGNFPLYYVPGDNPEMYRDIVFDVEAAPLTVWNMKTRISGNTRVSANLCADDLTVASSMLTPEQKQMFTDAHGCVPDTLHFAYITMIPKPLQYAPVVDVH